ncbi:MAG: carbohydrate ABC transporter permease [Oscillospiraceae bacterium]|jgi:putative aldouronate transport system permease protein|nr:carbohydrate ABC transporter permease [Oscillospiraceae bacterium]
MARQNKIKLTRGDLAFEIFNTILMVLVLIVVLYPLYFIVIASVSDSKFVSAGEVWFWPKGFHLTAYKRVFTNSKLLTGYRNTIIYTFIGTIMNLIATVAIAYPLSRKDFVGRNVITLIMTITMFFGGGLIPTYLCYKQLGLVNNPWVMMIPGLVSTYNTILVRTFFQGLPYDLQEAAMIDGCSNMRILLQIILPLSKPILAVMAIYYGVGHWNAYFDALVFISDDKYKPLALVLRDILVTATDSASGSDAAGGGSSQVDLAKTAEAMKYAVIIVSTVPVLCLYPFLQKHFAKGVMLGAIKG